MKRRRTKATFFFFEAPHPAPFPLHTFIQHFPFVVLPDPNMEQDPFGCHELFMLLTMKGIVKCLQKPDTSKLLFAGLFCSMIFCETCALSRRWVYKYFCPAGSYNQVLLFLRLKPCYHPAEKKTLKNKQIEQFKRLKLRRTSANISIFFLSWPRLKVKY